MALRYMQREAVDAVFQFWADEPGNPLVDMATGCHAPGTQILMFDGSTKPVELVAVNDNLMGPDSRPRRVLRTVTGVEPMYRVTPVKGESFVVNEGHILSLKTTNEGMKAVRHPGCHQVGGIIENVRLSEWLGKAKSWKHVRKLWRSGVDFAANDNEPVVPAYLAGVMLGDGSLTASPCITSMDPEILDAVCDYVEALGVGCRIQKKPDNQAYQVYFPDELSNRSTPNRFTDLLRKSGLWGQACAEKHVPHAYKIGSRATRLNVLAGLLDTDGHLSNGTGFDFIAKSERMSRDVAFIARSLGFAAYVSECQKASQLGTVGTYWRVSITGDVDEIPVRIPRKKARKRKQIKNPLVTGFRVEPVGEGQFYGFALDGDHLYLTADFTVHHNTGKSITMATLIHELVTNWADMRVMNVAHREELVEGNFKELLSVDPFASAGIYAASLGRRDAHAQIIFGQIQTVYNKASEIGHVDVLVIDEVHLLPRDAETQYGRFIRELQSINPDMKLVGFTATPFRLDSGRLDEGDDRMFDKVVYTYSIAQGIDDGYLAPLSSKGMVTKFDLTGVGSLGGDYKKGALAAAVDKAEITSAAVTEAMVYGKDRRTVLWFCSGVEHAEHVRDEVRRHGKSCEMLTGTTPKGERRRIIADLKSGKLWGCTNDAVLTVGTNIPGVDMIVDLAPTKSTSRFIQKAGRGTRPVYRRGFNANDPNTTAEQRLEAIANGPKPNCLYLDYARAIEYHGPVDKAQPRVPGSGSGMAPIKQCPSDQTDVDGKPGCDELIPISIMTCPSCGYIFPPSTDEKLTRTATGSPILSTEKPWFEVTARSYAFHPAKVEGKPPTVKATYTVDGKKHNEWLCPEHEGFPKGKSDRYWVAHGGKRPFPTSVEEFLDRAGELLATTEVQLDWSKNAKYPEVKAHRTGEAAYDTGVVAPQAVAEKGAGVAEKGNLAALMAPARRHSPEQTAAKARIQAELKAMADDFIPF